MAPESLSWPRKEWGVGRKGEIYASGVLVETSFRSWTGGSALELERLGARLRVAPDRADEEPNVDFTWFFCRP